MRRPDGYAVTFTYDAFGRRLSKRFRGQVTRWVWDGDEPLHEWQALEVGPGAGSAGEVLTWLFEDDSFAPLAKLTKQGASSVVCDHLGTPLSLHDAKGAVTWNLYSTAMAACAKGEVRRKIVPFVTRASTRTPVSTTAASATSTPKPALISLRTLSDWKKVQRFMPMYLTLVLISTLMV
jgi:YD repeat-containing protein